MARKCRRSRLARGIFVRYSDQSNTFSEREISTLHLQFIAGFRASSAIASGPESANPPSFAPIKHAARKQRNRWQGAVYAISERDLPDTRQQRSAHGFHRKKRSLLQNC